MQTRWPQYTAGALNGTPCEPHGDDECLCDVVIPERHPWSNADSAGGMWGVTTAEAALRNRGNDDPSPLEVMLQVVALHDAIAPEIDNIRHGMQHITEYREAAKFNNVSFGALTRALNSMGPDAVASVLGRDVDDVLAECYGTTAEAIREARRIIAEEQPKNSNALRVLLGANPKNPKNDRRRSELLRWLGYLSLQAVGDISVRQQHLLYDLVKRHTPDAESARLLGVPEATVARYRRGERGALRDQFKALKAEQKAAKKEKR